MGLLAFSLASLLSFPIFAYVGCKNPSGEPVDWWYAIKTPGDRGTGGSLPFAYADPATDFKQLNGGDLRKLRGNPILQTLQQVYEETEALKGYAMYNDQSPDGKSHSSRAHSKGVVGVGANQGFWLIHSVPKFPVTKEWADFYKTEQEQTIGTRPDFVPFGLVASTRYGQSFLCLTYDVHAHLTDIADAMHINWPNIHDSALDSDFGEQHTTFRMWIEGDRYHVNEATHIDIETIGGEPFRVFAKSHAWMDDLYDDLVAPQLQVGLHTETWQNGAHSNQMPDTCDAKYPVSNVGQVRLPKPDGSAGLGIHWCHTEDHSKWAISADESEPWACIGDVNRQFSQKKRGGGTVCRKNAKMWAAFNQAAAVIQPCDEPVHKCTTVITELE